MKTQAEWLNTVKTNGCISCHALGTPGTRTMPKDFAHFKSSTEAWARRIASGQAMNSMINATNRIGIQKSLGLWADWTDRIATGELPFAQPPRPQGVERNVVLTLWDWHRPTAYLHDLIGTDRRKPTINANGKFYGSAENSTDYVPILDPVRHAASEVLHPVRDPKTPSHRTDTMAPSPYWGDEPIWDAQTSNHNPMMDEQGRPWFTARIRPAENPDFCKKGSSHPSAKVFPLERSTRHLSMFDPKSGKFTLIGTCFQTHHLIFAEDAEQHAVDVERRRRRRRARLDRPHGCSTRPATRCARRAGRRSSSTPTATASATRGSSPTSRSIRPRTSASTSASTRSP